MQLKVIKDFSWAHRHVEIREYKKDDVIDTDDEDLIRVATAEKWAKQVKEGKAQQQPPEQAVDLAAESAVDQPTEQAAAEAAPQAAAEAGAPEVKAD